MNNATQDETLDGVELLSFAQFNLIPAGFFQQAWEFASDQQITYSGNDPQPATSRDPLILEFCRMSEAGFNRRALASHFGLSIRTVSRFKKQLGLIRHEAMISDEGLREILHYLRDGTPASRYGVEMTRGVLRAAGVSPSRRQVSRVLAQIDPVGVALRRRTAIVRRQYVNPGPNAVWHIDAYHKLVRWGIYVHGAVDGFSRFIVYLEPATRVDAPTVTSIFQQATGKYFYPSRVRADCGGENYGVCELMLRTRGVGRSSFMAGPSTRNVRIERLWRDVFYNCISIWYAFFVDLEHIGVLQLTNEHLFVLQQLFVPCIRSHLLQFSEAWNNHRMRTANGTPTQLYMPVITAKLRGDEDFLINGDDATLDATQPAWMMEESNASHGWREDFVQVPPVHADLLPQPVLVEYQTALQNLRAQYDTSTSMYCFRDAVELFRHFLRLVA